MRLRYLRYLRLKSAFVANYRVKMFKLENFGKFPL